MTRMVTSELVVTESSQPAAGCGDDSGWHIVGGAERNFATWHQPAIIFRSPEPESTLPISVCVFITSADTCRPGQGRVGEGRPSSGPGVIRRREPGSGKHQNKLKLTKAFQHSHLHSLLRPQYRAQCTHLLTSVNTLCPVHVPVLTSSVCFRLVMRWRDTSRTLSRRSSLNPWTSTWIMFSTLTTAGSSLSLTRTLPLNTSCSSSPSPQI